MAGGVFIISDGYAQDAQTAPPNQNKPILAPDSGAPTSGYLQGLSSVQSTIGGYVQNLGEGLDRFFGSEELDVVSKGNRLIVYTPLRYYDDGRYETSLDFKAQIDLPRTNRRWKLLISSFEGEDPDNDSSTDSPDKDLKKQSESSTDSQNTLAGRFLLDSDERLFSHLDLGLKFVNYIEPNPYIKYRTRYKHDLDESTQSRTTQTVYIDREDGFAWEGEQVFDHHLDQKNLARSQTVLAWWQEQAEWQLNQKLLWFKDFSPYRAHVYYLSANWLADTEQIDFQQIDVGLKWREQLYQDWLFAEVEPKVIWYDHDGQLDKPFYSLRLSLEMHFYQP